MLVAVVRRSGGRYPVALRRSAVWVDSEWELNKRELIAVLADKLDLSKTAAASMLHTVIETVIEEVENGHKVQLSGFGSFQASKRASRTLRNPSTGDLLQVAESKAVSFRAGQTFKDAVNKRK